MVREPDPGTVAQEALAFAVRCANCNKGRHGKCRETKGAPYSVPVCQCACQGEINGSPIISRLGTVVGRRMSDGRVYGFGPGRLPA